MKLSKSLLALVASAMVAGMVYAEEKPAATDAKPDKKEAKEAKPKAVRLTQPISLIETSLTAEQKESLGKIHQEFLDGQKKLKDKEETDSMAVLTDAQKTELKAALEKKSAEKKEKPAEKAAEKPAKAMEEKK